MKDKREADEDTLPYTGLILYIFLMILFLNLVNFEYQAYLISVLTVGTDPYTNIEVDLDLNGTQLQAISGTIYILMGATAGLGMGYLVDRLPRKWFLLTSAITINILCCLNGFTHSFWQILFTRMFTGVFATVCTPTSMSLIKDYFPHKMRGRANGIYFFGIYIGAAMTQLTVMLNQAVGWRNAIYIASAIGFVLSLLNFFLKEPKRGANDEHSEMVEEEPMKLEEDSKDATIFWASKNLDEQENLKLQDTDNLRSTYRLREAEEEELRNQKFARKLQIVLKNKEYLLFIFCFCIRMIGAQSIGYLGPQYFFLMYPSEAEVREYSIGMAIVLLGAGMPACYLGGLLGDKLEPKFKPVKGYLIGVGALIACVFLFTCYILQVSERVSLICLFCSYFFSEMWYGPFFSMVNRVHPNHVQGFATALLIFAGNVASALTILLLGYLGDVYEIETYPERCGYILGGALLVAFSCSCPAFIIAGHFYAKLVRREEDNEKLRKFGIPVL